MKYGQNTTQTLVAIVYFNAYRRHHSTETAMVRVLFDVLTAADTRQVTLLGLLDMSAAFDCVDHSILLQRLEMNFGVSGLALQWLTSFLTNRTQQVTYLDAIQAAAIVVRCTARLGARPVTIQSVHGRHKYNRRVPWPQIKPVR